MPALPLAPGAMKVVIRYTVGDKVAENVIHYQYTGLLPLTSTLAQDVADTIDTAVASAADMYPDTTTYESTTVTDLSTDMGVVAIASTTTTGTRITGTCPANTAMLASYTTDRHYRGGHPRTYLPWGCVSDFEDPQNWSGGFRGDASSAWAGIITPVIGLTSGGVTVSNQIQVSYYSGGVQRITPVLDVIQFTVTQLEIASMRRRDGRH